METVEVIISSAGGEGAIANESIDPNGPGEEKSGWTRLGDRVVRFRCGCGGRGPRLTRSQDGEGRRVKELYMEVSLHVGAAGKSDIDRAGSGCRYSVECPAF